MVVQLIVLGAVACTLRATDVHAGAPAASLDQRTTAVVQHLRGCVSAVTRIRQLIDLNAADAEVSRAALRAKAACARHDEAIRRTSTEGFGRPALKARAAIGYWERGLARLSRLTDHSKAQNPADATKLVENWRGARSNSLTAVTAINVVRKLHGLPPLKQLLIAVITD